MRRLLSVALACAVCVAVHAAPAATTSASAVGHNAHSAPAKAVDKPFGLTESLATLQTCPEARFDDSSYIALGGVMTENKALVERTPTEKRVDLITKLVSDENAKATAFAKTHSLDCQTAPEKAATYWNKMLAQLAAEQGNEPAAATSSAQPAPAAKSPPKGVPGTALTMP